MNPSVSFKGDCEAAFKYYEQHLGGEMGAIFRYGGTPLSGAVPEDWPDKIMHGSITIGGQAGTCGCRLKKPFGPSASV